MVVESGEIEAFIIFRCPESRAPSASVSMLLVSLV